MTIPEVEVCFSALPAGQRAAVAGIVGRIVSASRRYAIPRFYPSDGPRLQQFLDDHAGQSIAIAPGQYDIANGLTIPAGTRVNAFGSTLTVSTTETAVDMGSHSSWRGGKIRSIQREPRAQAHSCFQAGHYWDGHFINDFKIEDVELEAVGVNSSGIAIYSGSHNGVVSGVTHGDSNSLENVVQLHWGCDGDPLRGTFHPHNISIRNVKVGKLRNSAERPNTEACPIFLSGCYNVTVDNVDVEECRSAITYATGDYGFVHSGLPGPLGGVTVRGVTSRLCWVHGAIISNWGLSTGTINSGIVSISDCSLFGHQNGNGVAGIYLDRCDNVFVENSIIDGFPVTLGQSGPLKNVILRSNILRNLSANQPIDGVQII